LIDICEHVAESLSAYLDGDEATAVGLDRRSIEAHLAVCTYCGALRPAASATPRSGLVPPPPSHVWDGIEAALRQDGLIAD
jgi:hypothetical protein